MDFLKMDEIRGEVKVFIPFFSAIGYDGRSYNL